MSVGHQLLFDPSVAPRPYSRLRQIIRTIYVGRDGVSFFLLIGLSSAAAFLEALGMSLVALFAYSLMGQPEDALAVAGPLQVVYEFTVSLVGRDPGPLFGIIFLLVIAKAAVSTSASLLASWIRHDMDRRLYRRLISAYLDCMPSHWNRYSNGDLLNAMDSESYYVGETVINISRLLTSAVSAIVVSLLLIMISWELLVFAVLANLCLSRAQRTLARRAQAHGASLNAAGREFSQVLSEAVTNLRSIWAVNGQKRLLDKIDSVTDAFSRHYFRADLMATLTSPVSEVGVFAILGLMALTSSLLGLQVPATLSVMLLLYRIQPRLRQIEECRIRISQYGSSLEAVWAILNPDNKDQFIDGRVEFKRLTGDITLDNVSFTYPNAPHAALSGVSCSIPLGKITLLIGHSGSGKSTLIGLLMLMLKQQEGRIIASGRDITEYTRKSWFKRCAFVGQDIEMFGRSLGESLTILSGDVPAREVEAALDICGLTELVSELPSKLATVIGERGAGLSVGQRQRVGIARAILARPEFLVLDEATSGLDESGEDKLLVRLRKAHPDMTVLLVTHRLANARFADCIFVLDSGRLAKQIVQAHSEASINSNSNAASDALPTT